MGTSFLLEDLTVYPCRVTTEQDAMTLLVAWHEDFNGQSLKQRTLLQQIAEIVQLGVNLWSKNHDERDRERALAQAKAEAVELTVKAGAIRETVEIIDVEDVPLQYYVGNTNRVKIKAAGELSA